MTATVIDSRRRLVMPPELPARSAVTVQQLDDDTWIERMAEVIKVGEEIEAALADLASRGAWS